jgi:tetratricopeptide (TPR) repeat protein
VRSPPGPDEAVAADLERSAGRAQSRGGLAAAAALLERATVLTAEPTLRVRRALAAAQASFRSGAFDAALALLATAQAEGLDEFQSAEADLLRGGVAFASGRVGDAPPLLLKAAKGLEPFDPQLARETYLTAWRAASVANQHEALQDVCRAIQALPPGPEPRRPLDLLLDGLALLTDSGHAAATPILQEAAKALAALPTDEVLRWGSVAMAASNAVWDNDSALAISARQVQLVRDAGALAELPLHLSALGLASAWAGDFPGAASNFAEAEGVAAALGEPRWAVGVTEAPDPPRERSRSFRDDREHARARFGRSARPGDVRALGSRRPLQRTRPPTRRLLGRLRERPRRRRSSSHPCGRSRNSSRRRCAPGDAELARDALERLAETTQPCANDVALGIEARSRALLSDGAAAEDLYREAIDRLSLTRLRPELARAHLLFGEWLRREGRLREARDRLRAAEELFAEIGMEAFAERARDELAAAGREAAQARSRAARGAHAAGGADLPARPRRTHQRADRRPVVPESAHGRMAPSQGLRQARDRLAERPRSSTAAAGA